MGHTSRLFAAAASCCAVLMLSIGVPRADAALEVAALANADLLSRPSVTADDMVGPVYTATVTDATALGSADATVTMDGATTSAGIAISATTGEFDFVSPSAVAAFTEIFTFTDSGDVSFTFDVEGTITGSNPELVTLTLAASQDIGSITDLETLPIFIDSKAITGATTSLTVGPIPVVGGVPTEISFFLIASGLAIGTADFNANFLSTVTLTGATDTGFTAGSGNPYNSAPVNVVPTPATAPVLFIAGLLGLIPARPRRADLRR